MLIVMHRAHGIRGYGGRGVGGGSGTITVNMAPASISAQAGFYMVDGFGLKIAGIKKYRHRPTVDGPDLEVDFGNWDTWPHTIGANRVTSVTFSLALGDRQSAYCFCNLFWWG